MPYGFIKHIESKGYSPETVESYEKVTTQFFAYLTKTYNKYLEPYQINPSDIKNYLDEQIRNNKSISTINKELSILKTMFNYLWEINKVPVDPSMKIKRIKKSQKPILEISYDQILDLSKSVMSNEGYSKIRKAIFILASKGLKTSEFRFKKGDVREIPTSEDVEINLKNRKIVLKAQEASYFLEYYYECLFNGSEYVFTTKPRGEEQGGPIQVMSILNHLRAITQDYLPEYIKPLTLISMRKAIAYQLYLNKLPIQQIAKELGIEESSASNYLKFLTEAKGT